MHPTTIAVDHAKSVFEVAVSDHPGHIREHHRLSRSRFLPFFAERQPATVLLEACGSAHHWGRRLQDLGHSVVLLPPHAVRPYVARNKTDRADAKGILEAFRNEEIRPVPVKTVDQQTLTALHRLRSTWLASRTARINTARGLLREFGIAIPVGASHLVPSLWALLEDPDANIPHALRAALAEIAKEVRELDGRIRSTENDLAALARHVPAIARLRSVPGIGLLTATALVAFVGDPHRFPSGRHLAGYLGLTPREHSSGSVRRLGRISKRGDPYLRMLLIHGARAVLCHAKKTDSPDRLRSWALELERLRGHNKAAVALANKLARIAWAVWKHDHDFQTTKETL
jgi:transposase